MKVNIYKCKDLRCAACWKKTCPYNSNKKLECTGICEECSEDTCYSKVNSSNK